MSYNNFKEVLIPKNIDLDEPPYCFDCSVDMRLIIPKEGDSWRHFWGCPNFPKCKNSYSIDQNGNWYDPRRVDPFYDNCYEWGFW
jgi:ssDNA-binding Zn-finger/Zn-ribbon topoisomerase 1